MLPGQAVGSARSRRACAHWTTYLGTSPGSGPQPLDQKRPVRPRRPRRLHRLFGGICINIKVQVLCNYNVSVSPCKMNCILSFIMEYLYIFIDRRLISSRRKLSCPAQRSLGLALFFCSCGKRLSAGSKSKLPCEGMQWQVSHSGLSIVYSTHPLY